jgi:cytochrome c peroxidase
MTGLLGKPATGRVRNDLRVALIGSVLALAAAVPASASAQLLPGPLTSTAITALPAPANTPAWLPPAWHTSLAAPMLYSPIPYSLGAVFPELYTAPDPTGQIAAYQPGTATTLSSNAFFQSLGTNGRTCATCHSPESAMGISLTSIQQRYIQSGGRDPLFAPVDGATCPSNVPANNSMPSLVDSLLGLPGAAPPTSAYATILNKGLFRIALPVPANAQFTISVVSDPYGCNSNPTYDQATTNGVTHQVVSVYRRPLIAANLKFKVNTAVNSGLLPPVDLISGAPLPTYTPIAGTSYGSAGNGAAETGNIENGNIMWDGREPSLASQAIDATLNHAQATTPPTPAQVAQILAFETNVYAGQYADNAAGPLTTGGVTGGPQALSADPTGTFATAAGAQVMTLYNAWNPASTSENAQRASVYRGQQIFNNRAITISNVAGFNNAVGTNAFQGTCSTCHGQLNVGTDPTPIAQHDLGIGGDQPSHGGPSPATDLPIFKLTCTGGATTPYNGTTVLTNDPGKALITGQCADIGRFTVGVLRGLAARAPYFSDGSAPTLNAVVNFYNNRFKIGLSAQDEQDLVNFLNTL